MTVAADVQAVLDSLAAAGVAAVQDIGVDAARAASARAKAADTPGPSMASVRDETIVVASGVIRVRALIPVESPSAIVVYLHGGGWALGDVDGFDNLGRDIARASGATVLLVDYRLAPEHRYPVAVEDAWMSLLWADAHRADLARPGAALIVAGDSAGGNLAAVLTVRSRDRGVPKIDAQVLIYPVTDAGLDTPSHFEPENQHVLSRASMAWFWDLYAPGDERFESEASPLRGESLEGLPRAIILLAEHDPLRDEGAAYAARLRDAGVEVDVDCFDGQIHGFFSMRALEASARGVAHIATRIALLPSSSVSA